MSAREWKPGDVATSTHGTVFAVDTSAGLRWVYDDGSGGAAAADWNQVPPQGIRPLVVIDPDEIPAAKGALAPRWLRNLAAELRADPKHVSTSLENVLLFLADKIEEADPPEPRPEEPTGLGAVVEAVCGCEEDWSHEFVHDPLSTRFEGRPLAPDRTWKAPCGHHAYADLKAVRILSHGYDPEATS